MTSLEIGQYLIVKTGESPHSAVPAVLIRRLHPELKLFPKRRAGDYEVETAHLTILDPVECVHVTYCATQNEAEQIAATTPLPEPLP